MYTGKEKCEILRKERKRIAEVNGIEFMSEECHNEDECLGTCPKCDAEIRYLDAELNKKAQRGEQITVASIDSEIDDYLGNCSDENIIKAEFDDYRLGSKMTPGEINYLVPDWLKDPGKEATEPEKHHSRLFVGKLSPDALDDIYTPLLDDDKDDETE